VTGSSARPDGRLNVRAQRPAKFVVAFGLLAALCAAFWVAPPAGAQEGVPERVGHAEAAGDGPPGVVHLTFDDGPDQLFTPVLLDVLDRHGVRATFFPLGRNLERRWGSDEIQDLLNRGHALGNHSIHHRQLTKEHPWRVAADLDEASALLASLSGFRPGCYRAPYGDRNATVDEVAGSLGMAHVAWTADPQEWRNPWVPVVVDYLVDERHDGSIVLLHDRKWLSLHIVEEVVPRFLADGWRFDVVPDCRPAGEREARMATRTPGDVPVGRIEAIVEVSDELSHGVAVVGWAYDADRPDGGLVVRAALDGDHVAEVATTGPDHGFAVTIEGAVTFPLCLWAVDAGTVRHDSSLGCHRPGPVPDWQPPAG